MKKLAIAALALPLAGCISFAPKPPPFLLTLQTSAALEAGTTQRAAPGATITVAVPTVPQEIATLRVPVRSNPTMVAYLKDAQWVEPPNRLFARLLSDTITTRTGRVVVGSAQYGIDPGASLTGELRSFGVDAGTSSVVVTFDGALVRRTGTPLEKRRFEARVPVAAVEPNAVGVALSTGANQVASEVADWVGR